MCVCVYVRKKMVLPWYKGLCVGQRHRSEFELQSHNWVFF